MAAFANATPLQKADADSDSVWWLSPEGTVARNRTSIPHASQVRLALDVMLTPDFQPGAVSSYIPIEIPQPASTADLYVPRQWLVFFSERLWAIRVGGGGGGGEGGDRSPPTPRHFRRPPQRRTDVGAKTPTVFKNVEVRYLPRVGSRDEATSAVTFTVAVTFGTQ